MKLSEYCRKKNISYQTGYSWFRKGQIENAYQMPSGTILIKEKPASTNRNVIYLRIHPSEDQDNLKPMLHTCQAYCNARQIKVHQVYEDIASVEDYRRPQLWKMLKSNPGMIILYEEEAFTTQGFELIEHLLKEKDCYVQVVDNKDV